MNDLHSLQRDFQGHVFQSNENISRSVVASQNVDAHTRLGIYSAAYRLRLRESLQTDFPTLQRLLGDANFEKLSQEYLEMHPSTSPNIRWFGANLAQFLKSTHPYNEQEFLYEIARLEWAMTLAFDATDEPVLTISSVGSIPAESWAQMSFSVYPSIQRLECSWNVVSLWKAVNAEKKPPVPTKGNASLSWIVWRKELKIYFRSLPAEEAWALDAVIAGSEFAEICGGLCQWFDETLVAAHAAAMLKTWISEEMISRLSYPD